jgi:hypothetical protein
MYHEFLMPYVKLMSTVNKHLHLLNIDLTIDHDLCVLYRSVNNSL